MGISRGWHHPKNSLHTFILKSPFWKRQAGGGLPELLEQFQTPRSQYVMTFGMGYSRRSPPTFSPVKAIEAYIWLEFAAKQGQGQHLQSRELDEILIWLGNAFAFLPGIDLSIVAIDFPRRYLLDVIRSWASCDLYLELLPAWKSDSLQFTLIMSQWWPHSLAAGMIFVKYFWISWIFDNSNLWDLCCSIGTFVAGGPPAQATKTLVLCPPPCLTCEPRKGLTRNHH